MKFKKILKSLMTLAMVVTLPGCVAGADEDLDLETREQAFLGFRDGPNYLMDRIATGDTITVCLMGTYVDNTNFQNRKNRVSNAMLKWATAARGAGVTVPTFDASDIHFDSAATCRQTPDVYITWNTPPNGHYVDTPNGFIYVSLTGDISEHNLLHEMGHVFGLHDTYWKGHTGCLPGQAPSVMCGRSVPTGEGFTDLQPDDINGVREVYCVANPGASECNRRAEWNTNWCSHPGGKLHVGKFNNDPYADLLCHDTNNGTIWTVYADSAGKFGATSWGRSMGWCYGSNSELHIGDFNGDTRDDMLCHDKSTGHKTIAWSSWDGEFSESNLTATSPSFCAHSTGKLHVGDFDGDYSDDVLCHDTSNGNVWIDYRRDGLDGIDWSVALNWCSHSTGKLRVGNFDGDADDDLLCQDTGSGYIWIDYAVGDVFAGTDTTYDDSFCYGANGQLSIEDFNTDGREDLMCHNPSNGHKKVALATMDPAARFVGVSRQWQMSWCYGATQLLTGDFDANGSADFLCHATSSGYKWQAFQFP